MPQIPRPVAQDSRQEAFGRVGSGTMPEHASGLRRRFNGESGGILGLVPARR